MYGCPCIPLCSNEPSISSPLICPPPGRNWTSRVKGEPLLPSAVSCSLTHLSLTCLACPWNKWDLDFSALSASVVLNLCDAIYLLMCSEYPLQLLNGPCYINLSSCCNHVAVLDHIPGCLLSSACASTFCHSHSFFFFFIVLLLLFFLGLAPLAMLDSSPAEPASPTLRF